MKIAPDVLSNLLTDFKGMLPVPNIPLIAISCKEARTRSSSEDPGNLHLFVDHLVKMFENMTELPKDLEDLIGVTERQRQLLSSCSEHLNAFVDEAHPSEDPGNAISYLLLSTCEQLPTAYHESQGGVRQAMSKRYWELYLRSAFGSNPFSNPAA